MATRKTTKKARRATRPGGRRSTLAARLERELPRRVGEYVTEVQGLLDRLEREFQRASLRTRAQATRLLRQASRQLGTIERGQSNWARLVGRYRGEAARVLRALETAIAPAAPRKATTRRATGRAKKSRKR
jgi:hypothetical protein